MPKDELLIPTKKLKVKGLPAKSFIHIVELDYYIRNALSPLLSTETFDVFISSKIGWKKKYKARKQTVVDFINYLSCYDNNRVNFILPSKVITRSTIVSFIISLSDNIKTYRNLMLKPPQEMSYEEILFIFNYELKWNKYQHAISTIIPGTIEEIRKWYAKVIENYSNFIIKHLMARRKGEPEPSNLKTDAFRVLINMVDSYDASRSKIPFNRFLKYYVPSIKNEIIQEENWKLDTGSIMSLDTIIKNNSDEDSTKLSDFEAAVSYVMKEHNVQSEKIREVKFVLNKLNNYLPKNFFKVLITTFGLLEPLKVNEEVLLVLDSC